jgi:hypothetical protein
VLFDAIRLYCAEMESDGFVPKESLPLLALWSEVKAPEKPVALLMARNLLRRVQGGWLDVGFADVNPSHDFREKKRRIAKEWRSAQRNSEASIDTRASRGIDTSNGLQDRTAQNTPDVLTGKTPQLGDGDNAPPVQSSHSSQGLWGRTKSTNMVIDAELARAARQADHTRKRLLARAKMHDLASRSPMRVNGLNRRGAR